MITIHHTILRPQYTSNKIHPLTKMNLDKWGLLNKEINLIQKIWSHDECLKFLQHLSHTKFSAFFGVKYVALCSISVAF